jgi:hypothetical protein
MKHNHEAKVDINLDIPTTDIDYLIDRITTSVITIIAVSTAAHIFRKWVT